MRDNNRVPRESQETLRAAGVPTHREEFVLTMIRQIIREELQAAVPAATLDLLTYAEAAAEFRCGVSTLRKWAREGKLQRCGEGRNVRISRRELLVLLGTPKQSLASTTVLETQAEAILRRAI